MWRPCYSDVYSLFFTLSAYITAVPMHFKHHHLILGVFFFNTFVSSALVYFRPLSLPSLVRLRPQFSLYILATRRLHYVMHQFLSVSVSISLSRLQSQLKSSFAKAKSHSMQRQSIKTVDVLYRYYFEPPPFFDRPLFHRSLPRAGWKVRG